MKMYAIQAESGGPIKFGLAGNPATRLVELQCGHPDQLVLLCTSPILGRLQEADLHRALSRYRHRSEWFRDNEITQAVIVALNEGAAIDHVIQTLTKVQANRARARDCRRTARYIRWCRDYRRQRGHDRESVAFATAAINRNRQHLATIIPISRRAKAKLARVA